MACGRLLPSWIPHALRAGCPSSPLILESPHAKYPTHVILSEVEAELRADGEADMRTDGREGFQGDPGGPGIACIARAYCALPLYALWVVDPPGVGCPQGQFSIFVFGPPLDAP
jgi:hypothetical protein